MEYEHLISWIVEEGRNYGQTGNMLSPFMGLSLAHLAGIAQQSENAGIRRIFIPEGKNDGLLCWLHGREGDQSVMVATWILNMFLREAAPVPGRPDKLRKKLPAGLFGVGVSHRPLVESLGIGVPDPRERLRRYTYQLRNFLEGQDISRPIAGGVPDLFSLYSHSRLFASAPK